MKEPLVLFSLNLLGFPIIITLSIVVQWVLMAIITIVSIILTRNLKKVPDRKQNIAEIIVTSINGLVKDNMGEEYMGFVPYIGTLIIFLLMMNFTGLFGVTTPSGEYSVALGFALISFAVVNGYAIKRNGVGHYLKAYAEPFVPIAPINIMERIMLPVSLSLRLFGNMMAGIIIIDLVYESLHHISWFAQIGIPVALHFYFDVFEGIIQMFIFAMLTMIYIKIIAEE